MTLTAGDILSTGFSSWTYVVYLVVVLTVIIFLRYFFFSILYKVMVYDSVGSRAPYRIISVLKNKSQRNREIYYSALSSFLFAIGAILLYAMYNNSWTTLYLDISSYPLWYMPVSILLASFIQETYYYWLHRWMHHPNVFKHIHLVHHKSVSTSVWTSFSFHPYEAILQIIIIPIIVLIVPMQVYVFLFFMLAMSVSAVINHAGVEIFPKSKKWRWIAENLVGSTHHDIHHRKFKHNFGLYFTFWDRWMNTESKDFITAFEKNTGKIQRDHMAKPKTINS